MSNTFDLFTDYFKFDVDMYEGDLKVTVCDESDVQQEQTFSFPPLLIQRTSDPYRLITAKIENAGWGTTYEFETHLTALLAGVIFAGGFDD